MTENRITRKDLWRRLPNEAKKLNIWFKAAEKLDLCLTQPKGGTSHYAIRLKGYDFSDERGLISVIYGNPVRKDVCEAVFKKMLDKGLKENDIWKALGML